MSGSSDDADQNARVRQARADDYEAVAAFTRNTWPDRGGDYIPRIYHEWIAGDGDGDDQRTFVVELDGEAVGICQGVLLSAYEAWAQGMRIDSKYRGRGLSRTLNDALFEWARERGAVVCRNMVFSSNAAGLGGSRGAGFRPAAEFRWAHPEPDPEAEPELDVRERPNAAWSYWTRSDARSALRGLALDFDESWAVSELRRADLERAAADTRVFAVRDDGTRGFAYRVRDYEREVRDGDDSDKDSSDGNADAGQVDADEEPETERWAEYGVGAWADAEAARSLLAVISADAAGIGADRTRVLIPETPRHVSDVAYAQGGLGDEPDFVFEADLS